jgi:deoxyribodipyrimidine photolyase-related protein
MIEVEALKRKNRHRTRTALYLSAMRHFAREAGARGIDIDYRQASSFEEGLAAHGEQFAPSQVVMHRPHGRRAQDLFTKLGVEQLPNPFFLTDVSDFASRRYATMEAFYRQQRQRLNVLMNDGQPEGGQWNFDAENRQPLPRDGANWPDPWQHPLDLEEESILRELEYLPGGAALEYWPRTRSQALDQLHDAVERIIPLFGPYEDAASSENWHLAHTRLSVALNLGLLHPREVVAAIEYAYRDGQIPLASAEGVIRQIIGWREWVFALHQSRDCEYESLNYLSAREPVPEAWQQMATHPMNCLSSVLSHVREFGWTHHIERLMVLANAATLLGISPRGLSEWMTDVFVDGAQWVMEANVIGMGTFADGGQTATKPYVAGGNYIKKMTNFCRSCVFTPTERTGERACPLTTLYWDFFDTHGTALASHHRVAPQVRAAAQRVDINDIRLRAPRAREIVRGTS